MSDLASSTFSQISPFMGAYLGTLVGDALAMPVHWYYDRVALQRDYGVVDRFLAPRNPHPDSILWRSTYVPVNATADILHDQARYWGQRGIHYHQNLRAGENTLNFQLAAELYRLVLEHGTYNGDVWLERYIHCLQTPGWHRDTYVEEYHRAFFTNLARGKKPRACGIDDGHIGGLVPVAALLASLTGADLSTYREIVREHISLTHRNDLVLRAADVLTHLLHAIANQGVSLDEALTRHATDFFSLAKANGLVNRSDDEVVGRVFSPACYIDDAFPAALYLAWKYQRAPKAGLIANAMVGGDNCHRAAVVGALLGCLYPDPSALAFSIG
jgi:ADP-ribosyl-[dinitrogen reductase] hydrolase